MKLFLTSEAKHPTSLNHLQNFVDGFSGKRIVYIPTAANGGVYGSWKSGESIKTIHNLGALVEVVELEDSSYLNIIAKIDKPDILWFGGGMSGYLLYWIRRVELDKRLPKLLSNGTIYVGSSAGSMICARTQNLADWYLGETEPGAQLVPGLGLIDFEIYPHYQDELKPEIEKRWTEGKLCLLKDGEAIAFTDNQMTIYGESRFIERLSS